MSQYLFIDSRDAFESRDTEFVVATASSLRERGHEVTLFLVSNGVMAARSHTRAGYLSAVAAAGVSILADDFSLRERGITDDELHPGVRPSGIEVVVDMLAAGTKAIWH